MLIAAIVPETSLGADWNKLLWQCAGAVPVAAALRGFSWPAYTGISEGSLLYLYRDVSRRQFGLILSVTDGGFDLNIPVLEWELLKV